jgi:diguanylate cyclase (GGDEF)-like protein
MKNSDYHLKQNQFNIGDIDADFFKEVNDRYGQAGGDITLKTIVQSILETVRAEDIIGRIGGEEFAVICPRIDQDGLILSGTRVRENIAAKHITHNEQTFQITCSVGCALYRLEEDLDSLLQ